MFGNATQNRSIRKGGFFDRHPILVPATAFSIFWIPYVVIFFRKTIAFGDLGGAYPLSEWAYWVLLALQLLVCVISHSLTIRTIVRLYAPKWLIWGSIAFYALSPAWGLMVAADIRHPLFAAVFCVYTSSATFTLYGCKMSRWLCVQLGLGALCVCLLRENGAAMVLPGLVLVCSYKLWEWRRCKTDADESGEQALYMMDGTPHKSKEARWSDVCAAFLTLCAVGLLFLLSYGAGFGLPLGEPSYGWVAPAAGEAASTSDDVFLHPTLGGNLTGTDDVAGILPFATLADNSVLTGIAEGTARLFMILQSLPIVDLTFSYIAYVVLFLAFLSFSIVLAIAKRKEMRDVRPLILAIPMLISICYMAFVPSDDTLRYIMPILAAQPMFFGALIESMRFDRKEH